MDSPGAYPESPLDQDDVVYPCKGCGEVFTKSFRTYGTAFADYPLKDPGGRKGIRIRYVSKLWALTRFHARQLVTFAAACALQLIYLTLVQLETDGISIASAATPAALSSTPTRTFSSLAMDPSYATTAHTAAITVGTR